jgi:hypothetical protein
MQELQLLLGQSALHVLHLVHGALATAAMGPPSTLTQTHTLMNTGGRSGEKATMIRHLVHDAAWKSGAQPRDPSTRGIIFREQSTSSN